MYVLMEIVCLDVMKKHVLCRLTIIAILAAYALCGCGEQDIANKSSFGQVDAMQDGKVLIKSGNDAEDDDENADKEDNAATGSATIKTAKTLDVEELPGDVADMAGLCDAINMACVEQQKIYDHNDAGLVWHCVHLYVCNCNDKRMGFETISDYREASPRVVDDVIYAMFGKLREIPKIPEAVLGDSEGEASHVMISNDLKYRFRMGDRGVSEPVVRRATQYSDGSLEMEVALVDSDTDEETVSFLYTMRANTRDTTTSARFKYEITGVRPADKITSDKISGVLFLSPVVHVYGYDSYPKDDAGYNEIEEILFFNSFKEHVPGMEELNQRISNDIMVLANTEPAEGQWHEIISYPLTTDEYVQVAVTFATYPDDDNDPDIRCYSYDKKKNRAMDINDALGFCGISREELDGLVRQQWEKNHSEDTIGAVTYKGYIVRADNSVDFFYVIKTTDNNGTDHLRLTGYNNGSGKLTEFKYGQDLIPDSETDTLKPPLTHGRKD